MNNSEKESWVSLVVLGAEIWGQLHRSCEGYCQPSDDYWLIEFRKRVGYQVAAPLAKTVCQQSLRAYKLHQAAPATSLKLSVEEAIQWDDVEVAQAIAGVDRQITDADLSEQRSSARTARRLTGLRVVLCVFIASCVFVPWQHTLDHNGADGFHTRKPAGYAFIGLPPAPLFPTPACGVVVDVNRLLIQWAGLAGIAAVFYLGTFRRR